MLDLMIILILVMTIGAGVVRFLFKDTITWKEMAIQMAAQCVIVAIVVALAFTTQTSDTKVISGQVTSKAQVKVSCEHSYSCHCTTSRVGDSTTTTCQTCYDHRNDWDWRVKSNVGSLNIARVDRRGKDTPPRWDAVKIGEPFSTTVSFKNYIKASPDTLFAISAENEVFFNDVPDPTTQIYDYYKSQRIKTVGKIGINAARWDQHIAEIQKTLGPAKDANLIFVITDNPDPSYRFALESKWLGGKINDVIVLVGAPQFPKIGWVDVITYGRNKGNELFTIMVTDELTKHGTVDLEITDIVAGIAMKKYDRVSAKDFEYLEDSVTLTTAQTIAIILLMLGVFIGLTILFHKEDV